ncbi:MAG: sulfatase [Alphaproteobacteria bacterium]
MSRHAFIRVVIIIALVALAVACVTAFSCSSANQYKGRNVILISVDTLRADHVGCYGYDKPTTPRIDALAEQGMIFKNTYATSPWTLPSHTSMLTGLFTDVHGLNTTKSVLKEKAPTLAKLLHKVGYRTMAVVCAPFLDRHYGLYRGFDVYDTDLVHPKVKNPKRIKVADDVTDKALRYIDQAGDEPFFLFLHYWDPHHPYNPQKKYIKMFDPDYEGKIKGFRIRRRKDMVKGMDPRDLQHILALYDGEIRYTDDGLGRLFDGLTERGLMDKTLIVLTADHGEEFLEHGGRAHLSQCWDVIVKVPMIWHVPWIERHAPTFNDLASLVDITPTILDLVGIERGELTLQGRSLAYLMQHGTALEERELHAETIYGHLHPHRQDPTGVWTVMITPQNYKYHQFKRRDETLEFLFDLNEDPGEQNDLAKLREETLQECNSQLKKMQQINNQMRHALKFSKKKKPSKKVSKKLKSLGYIN